MIELKKHDLVYIPSIDTNHHRILKIGDGGIHCYVKIKDGDSNSIVRKIKITDTFETNKRNKELLDELYNKNFDDVLETENICFEYESLLYVPELGTGVYEVSYKIGGDCYVTYYSYDELDDVLFKVNIYNAFLANRENRLILDKLYNTKFSPTIYENSTSIRDDSLSGDECIIKMLGDGIKNILCKTPYKGIIIVTSVDEFETFTDIKNDTYGLLTPIELLPDGIFEILYDNNGCCYYTIPHKGKF